MRLIVLIQLISIAVVLGEIVYIGLQPSTKMQRQLLYMCLSVLLMLLGYLEELVAVSEDAALSAVGFSYIGKVGAMIFSFLFSAAFFDVKIKKGLVIGLMAYGLMFPVLIFTNSYHQLYYSSVEYIRQGEAWRLQLGHGPFYILYMVTTIVYLLTCLGFALRGWRRARDKAEKQQTVLCFMMIASSVLGYLLYLSGVTGGYDSTMGGMLVALLCLLVLFSRHRLFNILSLAKEQALMEAAVGLLVSDARQKVVYCNKTMTGITGRYFTEEELVALPGGCRELTREDKTWEIRKTPLLRGKALTGHIVECVDVSDAHAYSVKLEKEVERRAEELRHVQRKVIAGISSIVEARDNKTGDHIQKTAYYVRLIAEGLREDGKYTDVLTDEYIRCLTDAAPLHDLGKISIPDVILLKPGRLTEAEYEIVKTHTSLGENIVEQTMQGVETEFYVEMAKMVALYHHERWDGTGYPSGRSGEAIPLCARIVAVADVYDALRSPRVYKPSVKRDEACRIIREGSGKQFDPAVAESFLKHLREPGEAAGDSGRAEGRAASAANGEEKYGL